MSYGVDTSRDGVHTSVFPHTHVVRHQGYPNTGAGELRREEEGCLAKIGKIPGYVRPRHNAMAPALLVLSYIIGGGEM